MAVYFSNQPTSRTALLGEQFGGGISSGLSGILNTLATNKINDMLAQQQGQRTLQSLEQLGQAIPQEHMPFLKFISQQPLDIQKKLWPDYFAGLAGQPGSQVSQGGLPAEFGAEPNVPTAGMPAMQAIAGAEQPGAPQAPGGRPSFAETMQAGKIARNPNLAIQKERIAQKERHYQEQKDIAQKKERSDIIDAATKAYKAAKEDVKDISILKELNENGDLWQGPVHGTLKKLKLEGIITGNTPTEVARKISEQRINKAFAKIGATGKSITAALREQVERSQASLYNTKEGFDALLSLDDLGNYVTKKEFKELHNIINKKPNISREELQFEIADAMDKYDDEIAHKAQQISKKITRAEKSYVPSEDPKLLEIGSGYRNPETGIVTHIVGSNHEWIPYERQ